MVTSLFSSEQGKVCSNSSSRKCRMLHQKLLGMIYIVFLVRVREFNTGSEKGKRVTTKEFKVMGILFR